MFGRLPRHSGIRAAVLSTFASLVLVSSAAAQQAAPTIDNPAPDASASDGIYTPFTNRTIYQAIASDYQELVRISNEVLNVPDVAWTSNAAPPTTAAILKIYEEPVHANINGAYRRLRGFTFEPVARDRVPRRDRVLRHARPSWTRRSSTPSPGSAARRPTPPTSAARPSRRAR